MRAMLAADIVSVDGVPKTGRDIVAAGLIAGIWEPFERDVAAGVRAVAVTPPDRAAVDAAIRELRYAHKLISADEFVAWLRERDLTVTGVREATARRLAREAAPDAEADVPAEDVVAVIPVDAMVCGVVARTAAWLVDRLVALGDGEPSEEDHADARAWQERESGLLTAAYFAPEDPARTERRLALLVAADRVHRAEGEAELTEAALASVVARHGLDWLTVEVDELRCPGAKAAAEAAALLREETPVARVAERSGSALCTRRLFAGEAPAELQGELMSAAGGDTIGPNEIDGASIVWLVRRRTPPSTADAGLRSRAGEEILGAHWERRRAGRAVWHGRH